MAEGGISILCISLEENVCVAGVKSLCSLVRGKKIMKDLVKNTMYSIHGCAPCLWPSLQESSRSKSQITLCIKKRLVIVEQK